MRTVTITIESSEGPAMSIRKRVLDPTAVEVSIWRGNAPSSVSTFSTHAEALDEMTKAAAMFVNEVA